ncbi:hypothetical protein PR048_030564 [Dryococelus australis]|uniref:Uncharacterized protein n=1 Tax=Dryococelus australis TaxID=614101 RepID=A0ABQ9G9B7_9NEOP|nr:hypothetical protein PR048_030564 [Dryococelus australis]
MAWGVISYDSRIPVVMIEGTLTALQYVQEILRACVKAVHDKPMRVAEVNMERRPRGPADQRHRPARFPNCENPVTRPGIEPGSPWWEASVLIAQPPWPLKDTKPGPLPELRERMENRLGSHQRTRQAIGLRGSYLFGVLNLTCSQGGDQFPLDDGILEVGVQRWIYMNNRARDAYLGQESRRVTDDARGGKVLERYRSATSNSTRASGGGDAVTEMGAVQQQSTCACGLEEVG